MQNPAHRQKYPCIAQHCPNTLRSSLNPILGWVRLLQSRTFDHAKTAEALTTIERNAKLQAKLIEDLLDVSRILCDKLTLKTIPIDLEHCISGALDTVRLAAQAKEIDIQTVFDRDELVAAVARLGKSEISGDRSQS